MPPQPITQNAIVGSVAAAATTGALIAMGHRAGSAAFPFAAVSSVLLHRTPSAAEVGLVFTGLVLHVALVFAWTAVYVWLRRRQVGRDLFLAGGVAVAQFALMWIVAASTGTGLASVLPLGDRIAFAVVFTGALVAGMRLARVSSQV